MDGTLSLPALLAWKARFACACRRATSCGDGGGGVASGSGAVSVLPFALFPFLLFFFAGCSWDGVDEDVVGVEMWEAGT